MKQKQEAVQNEPSQAGARTVLLREATGERAMGSLTFEFTISAGVFQPA